MSLRDQFATDEAKESEGTKVTFGENDDKSVPAFIVGRIGPTNKLYSRAMERATKPYMRQIQLKTFPDDKSKEVMLSVFIETILKSWEHVKKADLTGKSEDKGELAFNAANAKALMLALPELYSELLTQATDVSNFRLGIAEESAKKLTAVLLYMLDLAPHELSIAKQAAQANRPLPANIANAPELDLGLQLYLQAFFDLNSERPSGFGICQIPGSAVRAYCKEFELYEDQSDTMQFLISEMDRVYIDRQIEKDKAASKK